MKPHSQTSSLLWCLSITARCVTHTAFQESSRQPDRTLQSTWTIEALTPHSHRCAPPGLVPEPPNLDNSQSFFQVLSLPASSKVSQALPACFGVRTCSINGERIRITRKCSTENFQALWKVSKSFRPIAATTVRKEDPCETPTCRVDDIQSCPILLQQSLNLSLKERRQ
jgi:hypothetical protein